MITTTRRGSTVFCLDDGQIYYATKHDATPIDIKRKFALDEAAELVDSVFAARVIKAVRAKLEPQDVDRIMKIMKDAGLITDAEMRAVNEEIDAETNGPSEPAMDAMFPHAGRLKPGYGGFDASRTKVPVAAYSAKAEADYLKMFPDAGRLK